MDDSFNSDTHSPVKALLVYPGYPPSFWNYEYSLRFIGKKAAYPPLGLMTVASMLPKEWEKKFVDTNIHPLEDEHLKWADYVFISAADMQKTSATIILNRCNELGKTVVAGGPLFTEHYEDFENADHLVLGEAEASLPRFLEDLKNGNPKHLYMPGEWPDMRESPAPMWSLVDLKKYLSIGIQYSRGCPFDCEFCQITKLFGRKVRTKSKEQIIEELEAVYRLGWRERMFFVDDNFIGNKHKLKTETLPAIAEWMEKRGYPFKFLTQASINLADDEELIEMMVRAGFDAVFLGIETVNDDSLAEAGKFHNRNRDLVANVKKLQRSGLEVWSGIILGFDSDKESIFDNMVRFIQESAITVAMVGLLTAMKGTRLYKRLEEENRLISYEDKEDSCQRTNVMSTDYDINFIPKMDSQTLLEGYRKVVMGIYSPKPLYTRIVTFLKEFNPPSAPTTRISYDDIKALIRISVILGILDETRIYYWKLFLRSLLRGPKHFYHALSVWCAGYHFRKVFEI